MLLDYSAMQLPSLSLSKSKHPSDCKAAKEDSIIRLAGLVKTSMFRSKTNYETNWQDKDAYVVSQFLCRGDLGHNHEALHSLQLIKLPILKLIEYCLLCINIEDSNFSNLYEKFY